jgi:hypothetical protein
VRGLIKSNGSVSRSKDTCSRRSIASVQWRGRAAVAVRCLGRVGVVSGRERTRRRGAGICASSEGQRSGTGGGRDGVGVVRKCLLFLASDDGGWSVHVLTSRMCLAAGEGRKAVEAGGKRKCLRKNNKS